MGRHEISQIVLLLIEDDEIDAEAIRRAFRRQNVGNEIIHARDGVEGLEVLRNQKIKRPFAVLLDLNMPRMSGIEFLKEIRDDPHLRQTIVFVLTTSDADDDKLAAYDQLVAGYMVKSRVGDGFVNLIDLMKSYWGAVEFPPNRAH